MPPTQTVDPPGGVAGQWVRTVVTFTVGIAIGLAPYLGLVDVPPFVALLQMIPDSLRDSTIPLSAALVGIIAIAVQWYAGERVSRKWLRPRFGWALLLSIVALFGFMYVHSIYVVTVRADGGVVARSFVVGTVRQPTCGCPATDSDANCIHGLGWDEAAVAQCWGDRAIREASLILRSSYLLATASFGALVGLVSLRRER